MLKNVVEKTKEVLRVSGESDDAAKRVAEQALRKKAEELRQKSKVLAHDARRELELAKATENNELVRSSHLLTASLKQKLSKVCALFHGAYTMVITLKEIRELVARETREFQDVLQELQVAADNPEIILGSDRIGEALKHVSLELRDIEKVFEDIEKTLWEQVKDLEKVLHVDTDKLGDTEESLREANLKRLQELEKELGMAEE